MSKSFIDFKIVKTALRFQEVLDHYGIFDQFKRSGENLSGACPIHKGSNPTQFRVSLDKNIWNCFGECKGGGNILDFIAKMENLSIRAAAERAVEWFQIDVSTQSPQKPSPAISEKAKHDEKQTGSGAKITDPGEGMVNKPLRFTLDKLDRAHPYLAERGLSPETIAEFGLGFCAKGTMANRIAIPIRNPEGAVVAYAGRLPGAPAEDAPKYKLPQGFKKSLELFNLNQALKEPKDNPLVIVEGFFDCLRLCQHGYRKVVALMGSSMSPAQENLMRKSSDRHSRAILMLDEDESGRAAREEIALRLSKFLFVKIHIFAVEGQQPEHLSADEITSLLL